MRSNVLDRIHKLEEERFQLLEQARTEALQSIQNGIDQLNDLGFSYSLVEGKSNGAGRPTARRAKSTAKKAARGGGKGTRRSGIREDVLTAIASSGKDGMTRGELIASFRATDDSFKQSISNALAALKKQKKVKAAKGIYRAA